MGDLRLKQLLENHTPFGLLAPRKPRHFRAIVDAIGENWGRWHKAWRVLNGPCNGCAVQTDGLRDNVLPRSPHFCMVRLGLIEEALRPLADAHAFADAHRLAALGNERIERVGRIGTPLLWRRGRPGYEPIGFDEAYDLAAEWVGAHQGRSSGYFCTSKAVCNEEYYAFQQFARAVGETNNVDSCARQCHAASVAALKSTLGVGASTGSLSDFMTTDVLVLAGTNLANNQPLVLRYIEEGRRRRRGKPYVIVVNPYREPGLERYWVPSSPRSAVFGSRICDEFVQVRCGGDVALFSGILKVLIEDGLLATPHLAFIKENTIGFTELASSLAARPLKQLESASGVSIEQMRHVATVLSRCENAMFVWGMGLTQHRTGSDNVKSVINLALALGQLGRPKVGLAALRGQSGVQASGECGVAPNVFPGGGAVDESSAERFSRHWGASVPDWPGLATGPMIESAERGEIKLLVSLGGNLRDTMPDRAYVQRVLAKTPFRIRLDVMMNAEAMIEPGEASLVLPIRNWYEWDSIFTTTSTDRTIRAFGGALSGENAHLPESWRALRRIADRVLGAPGAGFDYNNTQQIRAMMDRTIGMYKGITRLNKPHEQMQWGGAFLFANGFAKMPKGRARFTVVHPQTIDVPHGCLLLSTRRGFGQWNSQHRPRVSKDSFTGAVTRRAVLMHPDDVARFGLSHNQPVRVEADGLATAGVCWSDDAVRPGHAQAFWPVINDVIRRGVYDPESFEPDYNVVVKITPAQ